MEVDNFEPDYFSADVCLVTLISKDYVVFLSLHPDMEAALDFLRMRSLEPGFLRGHILALRDLPVIS